MAGPKPDAGYVMGLYQARVGDGDEARMRTIAATMRELVRLEHEVSIPRSYKRITKEVRTPFARDAKNRMAAALTQKPMVVHCDPLSSKRVDRDAANVSERWDTAAIETLNNQSGEDHVYNSVAALIQDGESVLKVVHRPDAWANFPEGVDQDTRDSYKKRAEFPFACRVVDRLQMLFGEGEYGDDWALEYGEYPRPYLAAQYSMAERDGKLVPASVLGGMPGPEGTVYSSTGISRKIEFFNHDWWAVVVDGSMAPGFPKPNPYSPWLPYFRAKAPDSESLLYALIFLVPTLDSLLTMKMNWATIAAYPTLVIETVPSTTQLDVSAGFDAGPEQPPGAKKSPLNIEQGRTIEMPQGKRASYLVPPPVGADIDEMISIVRSLIDVAGIPAVMRGVSGQDSGYALNQLMEAANLSFKVATAALQRQFARAFEFMHWMVANVVNQEVFVLAASKKSRQWLSLKPEGNVGINSAPVDAIGPTSVAFRPVLPTDEQALSMIANQLVQGRLISRRLAIEKYLQEEDPEKIMDEIWAEEELEKPPLSDQVRQKALNDAGYSLSSQPPSALSGLVDLQGKPLQSGASPMSPEMAGIAGGASGGVPSVPGLTMPLRPATPAAPNGGRAAGAYPGQPSNQGG